MAVLEHALAGPRGRGRAAPVVGVVSSLPQAPAKVTVPSSPIRYSAANGTSSGAVARAPIAAVGDLGLGAGAGQCLAERGERLQPPRPEHALGGLVHGGEDPGDLAGVVADRAERVREVGLLGEALRSSSSGWSSCQVACPDSMTPCSIGPIWSQISGQMSRSGMPIAAGCLAPSIGT